MQNAKGVSIFKAGCQVQRTLLHHSFKSHPNGVHIVFYIIMHELFLKLIN